MTNVEWIVLGVLIVLVALLVIGTVHLERKQQEWTWLHPPNEDEDGVFLLDEEDDDPDGQNSR